MRMPEELAAAFNRQATNELTASTTYLQMSAFLDARDLTGMSAWLRAQSDEERGHALRFTDFLLERGNEVRLGGIEAPRPDYAGAKAVFDVALEQERRVTAEIHALFAMASDVDDHASLPFLLSFIAEQVEEEAAIEGILGRIEIAADDPAALLLIDQELAVRSA